MKLGTLVEALDSAVLTGDPETVIEGIEYDSRLVKQNGLFIAVTGFKQDGYNFVTQAKENGAVAVLGERKTFAEIKNHVSIPSVRTAMSDAAACFYGYPGEQLEICGVTGTNGKTTTCYLMRSIIQASGVKTGLLTTQLYDTGKEQFEAERTTPEALDVQRLLFLMRKNKCAAAIIEVSSHALELHRVDNILFRVAIYTNFTRDHLDFHETMENYLAAKAKLIDKLEGEDSCAVINLDVPEFQQLIGKVHSRYLTYSLSNKNADVYCERYELTPEHTMLDLVTPIGKTTVTLKLPGRFNLHNAIAAAAGGIAWGAELDSIVSGLELAQAVPGRLNLISAGQPFAVYVDYAHTPDALIRLCEAAREITKGKLLLLFGCGGDKDRGKRPLMGAAATESADFVMVTTDNPRTEDPLAIIEEIKPGLKGKNFAIEDDRKTAIAKLMEKARPGDAVLLAGKGAEPYQEIKGVKHPFSDYDVAREALAAMGYRSHEESLSR